MKWFNKFMYGRYGADQLNMTLIITSMITSFLGSIFYPFVIISYITLFLCIYRMFSKQIYKRRSENDLFMQKTTPIRKWYKRTKNRWTYRNTHKYFKCPVCHQHLRVPRGKGNIEITCPHCHNHFDRRT